MNRPDPATLKAQFAADLDVVEWTWSGYSIARLVRSTGERPDRVDAIQYVLARLGFVSYSRRYPAQRGVFDHGTLWGRGRYPLWIVGHPYHISAADRELLDHLAATFPTLAVAVNDRPSFYGHGTHHVRIGIGVPNPRRPFERAKPPSTRWTRSRANAARRAFAEEGLPTTADLDFATRGAPRP